MSQYAIDEPGISALRSAVPEFEDAFREELESEFGELYSLQAMSGFARWTAAHVAQHGQDEVARRAVAAIEELITDETIQLGDALVAEFIENTWNNPELVELMGPRTRERAEPAK